MAKVLLVWSRKMIPSSSAVGPASVRAPFTPWVLEVCSWCVLHRDLELLWQEGRAVCARLNSGTAYVQNTKPAASVRLSWLRRKPRTEHLLRRALLVETSATSRGTSLTQWPWPYKGSPGSFQAQTWRGTKTLFPGKRRALFQLLAYLLGFV